MMMAILYSDGVDDDDDNGDREEGMGVANMLIRANFDQNPQISNYLQLNCWTLKNYLQKKKKKKKSAICKQNNL